MDEPTGRITARLAVAAVAGGLLLAGCGGRVTGTPAQLVRQAPERTIGAGSAHVDESSPGLSRAGDIDFGGDRADIVEHGRFGYREYRYVGGAWFQLGGEIGAFGEDLAGKWVAHPRAGSTDDVLEALVDDVRALRAARGVHKLNDGRFVATVDGNRSTVRLDRKGRVTELHRGTLLLTFSHFGTKVHVERPPADQLYVGHD